MFADIAWEWLALCLCAFLAGFVDSVVGGGGLIQLPALFILLPEVPPATLLGTNKFCSVWGTGAAAWQYVRRVPVELRTTLPACLAAGLASLLGASAATRLMPELLRPLVLTLSLALFAYTYFRPLLGQQHQPRYRGGTELALAMATGAALGFYDGFFGPGTGSFLVFAFVGLFGFSFLSASASAKLVNLVTNAAAIGWFAVTGHILYEVALTMAVFNVAGAILGARLAVRRGSGFVRHLYLAVAGLLILRLSYDSLQS